eukprot:TRINITY_DN260_c1_g3_i2.p1 TRINITY_DN260_c1_g3~~TRINITY_DN260_c1_g3_i2.p1  ORF type:complete len:1161 (+),score=239.97 TRINITY_DN260_c1_g3_i2:75-3485(+)
MAGPAAEAASVPTDVTDHVPMCWLLAKAAYDPNPVAFVRSRVATISRMSVSTTVGEKDGRALVAADDERKLVYLAFRGTTNAADWKTNLQAWPAVSSAGVFHNGFYARAELTKTLQSVVHQFALDGYTVVVTGHSLGGAVAVCTAHGLHAEGCSSFGAEKLRNAVCVTFGAPLVAVGGPTRSLFRHGRFLHVINAEDVIPKVLSALQDVCHRAFGKGVVSAVADHVGNAVGCLMKLDVASNERVKQALSESLSAIGEGLNNLVAYKPVGNFWVLREDGCDTLRHDSDELRETLAVPVSLTLDDVALHSLEAHSMRLEQFVGLPPCGSAAGGVEPCPVATPRIDRVRVAFDRNAEQLSVTLCGENLHVVRHARVEGLNAAVDAAPFRTSSPEAELDVRVKSTWDSERVPRTCRVALRSVFCADELPLAEGVTVDMQSVTPATRTDSAEEILKKAQAIALLTAPGSRFPRLRAIEDLLVDMVDSLPFEVALQPIAGRHELADLILWRFRLLDGPRRIVTVSEKILSLLQQVVNNLDKVKEYKARDSERLAEFVRRVEPLAEAEPQDTRDDVPDDMRVALTTAGFVSSAITIQDRILLGVVGGMVAGGLAASLGATPPVAAAVALGTFVHAATLRLGRVTDREGEIAKLKDQLNDKLRDLRSQEACIGCPEYCGTPMSFLSAPEADASAQAPLVSMKHHLHLRKVDLLEQERAHREDRDSQVISKSVHATFDECGLFIDMLRAFLDPPNEGDVHQQSGNLWKTCKFPVAVVGSAAWGVLGLLPVAFESLTGEGGVEAFTQYKKQVNDIWSKWWRLSEGKFATYNDFVKIVSTAIEEKVKVPSNSRAQTTWDRESRIVGHLRRIEGKALTFNTPIEIFTDDKYFSEVLNFFGDVPRRFRYGLCVRIRHVLQLHQLRWWLEDLPLVGVFGHSNSGKTSVMHVLLGGDGGGWLPAPGKATGCRTTIPRIFTHPRLPRSCVVDTPGNDDEDVRTAYSAVIGDLCAVRVNVVKWDVRSDAARELLHETAVEEALRPKKPTITLITHGDELMDDDDEMDPDDADFADKMKAALRKEEKDRVGKSLDLHLREGGDHPRVWACMIHKAKTRKRRFGDHEAALMKPTGPFFGPTQVAEMVDDRLMRYR